MFVLPAACAAFGGFPPMGTRVTFEVVIDSKTGRPRAENVNPEGGGGIAAFPQMGHAQAAVTQTFGGMRSGTMMKDNGNFGFIQQDVGGEDMFVMPISCAFWGGAFPPIGTRVSYGVVVD